VTLLAPAECTLAEAKRPLSLGSKLTLGAEVLATYGRVRWLMARNDLPTAIATLRRVDGTPAAESADEELAWEVGRRLGWITARTLGPVPGDSRCLMRSLVLTRMMARRGIPTTLIIGAQTDRGFAAHAWVERQGLPLLSPGSGYGRLAEL
jgi:Transglutaminase-like superfamily